MDLDPLVSWNVERRVQHCRCVENWCSLQIESSSFYKLGVQQNGVQYKEKTDLVGRCNINGEQKLKFSCVFRKSFYSFPFSAVGIKGRRIKGTPAEVATHNSILETPLSSRSPALWFLACSSFSSQRRPCTLHISLLLQCSC